MKDIEKCFTGEIDFPVRVAVILIIAELTAGV